MTILRRTAHEGLEDGEEMLLFFGTYRRRSATLNDASDEI